MSILDNIKRAFTGEKQPTHSHADHTHHHGASAAESYIAGIEHDRAHKNHFFRQDPYSPIEERLNFTGLNYYPPDPAYRHVLLLQPVDEPEPLQFQTNTGDIQTYYRIGTVEFEVEGEPATLAIYRSADHDGLFLPFRDATSGNETYGAGRYLEPHELGDGELLVDFNLAYNPFCAYSEAYSCPLPPFENHLKIPIRAGEKAYQKTGTTV